MMPHNLKIKLTEEQLTEVISNVIETLYNQKNLILSSDVLHECLHNYIICEGLIKSFSPNDVKKVLDNAAIKKYGITFCKLPFFLYKNKHYEAPCQIWLNFTRGLSDISEEYFDRICQIIDNMGWYIAKSSITDKDTSYQALCQCFSFTLVCEPKFDVLLDIDELPQKLYHITRKELLPKILKKGIVPKSDSMFSVHPERVYMFLNLPNNWQSIADNFRYGKETNAKFALLEIDANLLNKSNKVFIDQNSNAYPAVFTLETIPPIAITVLETED